MSELSKLIEKMMQDENFKYRVTQIEKEQSAPGTNSGSIYCHQFFAKYIRQDVDDNHNDYLSSLLAESMKKGYDFHEVVTFEKVETDNIKDTN